MDDLEHVLASLEQTETALRPPAKRTHDLQAELDALPPLAPPSASEQHQLSTSLAAELDAELDAVFANPQSESLIPGGFVHDLGAKHNDFAKGANDMVAEIQKFKTRIQSFEMILVPSSLGDEDKMKQSKEEIDNAYADLNKRVQQLFDAFAQLTQTEKGYFNVSSAKKNLSNTNKELTREYKILDEKFKSKTEENEKKRQKSTDTARNGTDTEDFSDITPDNDYTHRDDPHWIAYEKLEQTLKDMYTELEDKRDHAEQVIKHVEKFIGEQSQRFKQDEFYELDKEDKKQADSYHGRMDNLLSKISSQATETNHHLQKYNDFVRAHYQRNDWIQTLSGVHNLTTKKMIELEQRTENTLKVLSKILYDWCSPAYKRYHSRNGAKDDRLPPTHAPTAFHGPHAPTAFPTELICFAQKLITLVYPSTRVPPWSTSVNASRTSMPRTHNSDVHNKHLVALCTRVAHITAVADQHPLLAALRFALEITPKSPLLIHALKSTPTVLASRAAAEPHTNIVSIRACLAEDKLNRLIRIADADLNRMRIEQQQSKGNKIPQSVHTKTSPNTKDKHKHTHADEGHKHQHQNEVHDDNASQTSKKSKQTERSWGNGWGLFDKADKLVHSFTPRGSNQQTHEDDDVTGTNV